MGHSWTSFNGQHLHTKDHVLTFWLFLIGREIKQSYSHINWLMEAREHWLEEAKVSINGCIDPKLDEYLNTDEKVTQFTQVISSIVAQFESFGDNNPTRFLNEVYQYSYPFEIMKEYETQYYLVYGQDLLRLVSSLES